VDGDIDVNAERRRRTSGGPEMLVAWPAETDARRTAFFSPNQEPTLRKRKSGARRPLRNDALGGGQSGDAVAADPVVGGHDDAGPAGGGLGARREDLGGGAPVEGPVGTDGVVVVAEAVELGLQPGDGGGSALASQRLRVWWKRSTLPQVWGW
jgi:hypothetical protein